MADYIKNRTTVPSEHRGGSGVGQGKLPSVLMEGMRSCTGVNILGCEVTKLSYNFTYNLS